ncbi:MAG: hypothetical protein KAS32_22675 [Candidatus Peribacteraceae bacterium]|nr:hypothetical protein [Candidatus Peribacteraceae bacterium]
MRISAKVRKQVSRKVQEILKPTYFDSIPLGDLIETLKEYGLVLLQEDDTEWSGFLMGDDSRTFFTLGNMNSSVIEPYGVVYEQIKNAGLQLSWYRQEKKMGKQIEVIGYIS